MHFLVKLLDFQCLPRKVPVNPSAKKLEVTNKVPTAEMAKPE